MGRRRHGRGRGRRAFIADPLWRRAPAVLLSYRGAGIAVLASVAVLSIAAASAPLLLSAVASAAFERVRDASRASHEAVRFSGDGTVAPAAIDAIDRVLRDEVAELQGVAAPVASLSTMEFTRVPETTGVRVPGSEDVTTAAVLFRDGLLEALGLQLQDAPDDGVWLPDTLVDALDVRVGEQVELAHGLGAFNEPLTVAVTVVGTYDDPLVDGRLHPRAGELWRQAFDAVPQLEETIRRPPLVLTRRAALLASAVALEERVLATWEVPLAAPPVALSEARRVVAGVDAMQTRQLSSDGELAALLPRFVRPGGFDVQTALPAQVSQADVVAATLEPSLRSLSLSAQVMGLAIVAAAVGLLLRQQRGLLRLLAAQGATPLETGLRAPLEVLPAVLLGAILGVLVSPVVVEVLGPASDVDPARLIDARWAVGRAAVAALLVAALVAAAAMRATHRLDAEWSAPRRWPLWEPVALAVAAAAGYQLLVRSTARIVEAGTVDLLVLVFPLLAVAAIVGLAARGLVRVLPHLHPSPRGPLALRLASRRLTRAPAPALTLLIAAGMAFGLFVYTLTIAASTREAITAKTDALAGAQTSSPLFASWRIEPGLPTDLPPGMTFVWHDSAVVGAGGERNVRVFAIDGRSFADGARWHPSFADAPLALLLDRLMQSDVGDAVVPALAVGGDAVPHEGQLLSGGWGGIEYEVVAEAAAFPGMDASEPLVVVDARRLFPLVGPYDPTDPAAQVNPVRRVFRAELWSSGTAAELTAYLEASDVPLIDVRSRDEVAVRADLLAPTWSLGYLVVMGTAVGALAFAALIAFAEHRSSQRTVAYALARRMGLSRGAHLVATAIELVVLLAAAFVVGGAAAVAAAALVAAQVDPVPVVAPAPRLVLPGDHLLLAAAVVVAGAGLTALGIQHRSDRADVAEALRVAE